MIDQVNLDWLRENAPNTYEAMQQVFPEAAGKAKTVRKCPHCQRRLILIRGENGMPGRYVCVQRRPYTFEWCGYEEPA